MLRQLSSGRLAQAERQQEYWHICSMQQDIHTPSPIPFCLHVSFMSVSCAREVFVTAQLLSELHIILELQGTFKLQLKLKPVATESGMSYEMAATQQGGGSLLLFATAGGPPTYLFFPRKQE